MKFKDKRSMKIVFVSHCLINCNNKFPGYADVPGAYNDFIIPILKAGVGIFQMPCLEVLGWGGVGRKKIEFELDRDNLDQDWVKNYPKLCAEWARWTADQYQDYVDNGYEVLGVIHTGDSPTCGLDYVDSFPQIHFDLLDAGITWDNLVFDELVTMLETPEEMKARGADGKGAFMSVFRDELISRGYKPKFLPYVPTKPMQDQVDHYLNVMGLKKEK
jgi:predicted secreted protein